MRSLQTATTLAFVLSLAPLRAEASAFSAPDACLELEAQARKSAIDVRCDAGPAGLTLREIEPSQLKTLRDQLFPADLYLGHAVLTDAAPGSRADEASQPTTTHIDQHVRDSAALEQAVIGDFDNAVSRSGLVAVEGAGAWGALQAGRAPGSILLQAGPPGSGGGSRGGNGGPPGSGGRTGRGGPPGSGGAPGGDQGPSTPPSRPAPVWRERFPAPAPNWWNTDFNHYEWWESLPYDYGRPHSRQSSSETFFYYSGWRPWREVFTTGWGMTTATARIARTPENQGQVHTRSLTSQVYRDAKACYYQAVYRYDWAEGGIHGSHWEESFDHYDARCIRQPREYGPPRVYTAHVSFDMSMVQGPSLPWETDVVGISYDGQRPTFDLTTGTAFRYALRSEGFDRYANAERITLVAGEKIKRAPEAARVQAYLRASEGRIEFVVNDDRAPYYHEETLRVTARIIRRVVTREKGFLGIKYDKNNDTVIVNSPMDVVTAADRPLRTFDLTDRIRVPRPANYVRSSVFVDSWSFSRVNSRISTDETIAKGRGNTLGTD